MSAGDVVNSEDLDRESIVSAALLVGMACGLTNVEFARDLWSSDEKRLFIAQMEIAKKMLWGDKPTTSLERSGVIGLQDELMCGLVESADIIKVIGEDDGIESIQCGG